MASEQEFSWRRCLAWTVALGLHAAILVPLTVPMRLDEREAVVVMVDAPRWIDRERVTPVDVPMPPAPAPEIVPTPRVEERRARRRRLSPTDVASPAMPDAPARAGDGRPVAEADRELDASALDAPVARPLVYLDDEARAKLPHEPLYAATPPPREGDYYTPGDGSEDDVFYRPRALDPNPSRFAYAWRPRGNLIDDWLGRLVEKTTGTVSVPLNAKFSLVCKASIAGLGGGCAIIRNAGTGVIVQRPPPAPWERSNRVQCRELRQALENAEEAAQVAYFIERLAALCSEADDAQRDL